MSIMRNWKISTLSGNYFKRNILPILWEILCLTGFVLFPAWLSYSNAAFYVGLIIYFRRDIDLHEMWKQWKRGQSFWKAVAWTLLALAAGFACSVLLGNVLFAGVDDGMFLLRTESWMEIFLFACSTILLPPFAEELFFRKSLLTGCSGRMMILASILSIFLYSAEHSLHWLGILEMACIALPLTAAYVKTKNIHVVITAHAILNLIGNLPTVIAAVGNRLA